MTNVRESSMKPEVVFEEGKLNVSFSHAVDADHDGKPSAEVAVSAKLDAAEVVSEIAKKDMTWLENLIKTLKV